MFTYEGTGQTVKFGSVEKYIHKYGEFSEYLFRGTGVNREVARNLLRGIKEGIWGTQRGPGAKLRRGVCTHVRRPLAMPLGLITEIDAERHYKMRVSDSRKYIIYLYTHRILRLNV